MDQTIIALPLIFEFIIASVTLMGVIDSIKEHELRPTLLMGLGFLVHLALIPVTLYIPQLRHLVNTYLTVLGIIFLLLLIPAKPNEEALKGSRGYIKAMRRRVDERDIVFARNKLQEDSPEHGRYYEENPELRELDDAIRVQRRTRQLGKIDDGHPPNRSMIQANHHISPVLGKEAHATPMDTTREDIAPDRATEIVKGLATHLGAASVGVCMVNPDLVYSHRGEIHYGNWDDWGQPIDGVPPYALVFTTEMSYELVASAPHTPEATESSNNYAKGAYISTILAQWLKNMGYRAHAQHQRHYEVIMPALALDAGLGEVGRQGYLITPKEGARVRVFAVLTDMPLSPDKPIEFGVNEFCQKCLKCAETCPSMSIPIGEKTIHHGVEKWKLNAETCFRYWGEVGTDCGICMAVCPFSRPNTRFHNLIRWFISHSLLARKYFPIIEYTLYGREWTPKPVPKWVDYQ